MVTNVLSLNSGLDTGQVLGPAQATNSRYPKRLELPPAYVTGLNSTGWHRRKHPLVLPLAPADILKAGI